MRTGAKNRLAGEPTITRWDGASEQSLARALIPPRRLYRSGSDRPEGKAGRTPGRAVGPERRLNLMVTQARSLYRFAVARAFVDALQVRVGLAPELRERIHIALQEALMNALTNSRQSGARPWIPRRLTHYDGNGFRHRGAVRVPRNRTEHDQVGGTLDQDHAQRGGPRRRTRVQAGRAAVTRRTVGRAASGHGQA